jgi:hypothetical protein
MTLSSPINTTICSCPACSRQKNLLAGSCYDSRRLPKSTALKIPKSYSGVRLKKNKQVCLTTVRLLKVKGKT